MKMYKSKGNKHAVVEMMSKVHKMFADAGVPEERIDYIIVKWVKSTYPDALEPIAHVSASPSADGEQMVV